MARKVYKLTLEVDMAVLGLDSPLPSYALAGRLNRGIGWNLVRSRRDAELAFPSKDNPSTVATGKSPNKATGNGSAGAQSMEVSYFQLFFQDLDLYGTPLCLVSNSGSLGLLLPAMRNFNYLLTWPREAVEFSSVLLHRRIADLEGVNFAAEITSRIPTQAMPSLQFAPSLQEPKL